jgi:hypothetical protein
MKFKKHPKNFGLTDIFIKNTPKHSKTAVFGLVANEKKTLSLVEKDLKWFSVFANQQEISPLTQGLAFNF